MLLVHPRVIASHHWRPTTLQVLSTTTALSHSMDGLKGPQPASSPRRARRPCTTPKVARPHFPKQACIVIKHCRCLLRQHLRSCLVRFCVGGVRRVFACSQQVVGCLQATAPLRWPCMAPHLSVVQGPSFGGRPAVSRPICALHDPRPQQRNLPAHRAQHRPACQLSRPSPINRRHLPASPARRRPVRINRLSLCLPPSPGQDLLSPSPMSTRGKKRPKGVV